MRIATNVHRDVFGGITVSNLALFDWLEEKEDTIVGIEFVMSRHSLGASIFRHYDPSFFRHHIIYSMDVLARYPWDQPMWSIRKRWDVLVETTKTVLRQEAPDIVLINGTYYAPWILAKAAEELGIPVVLRYAGILKTEAAHRSYFVRRRLLAYEKWIASMADAVIFPSTLCKRVVETEVLLGPVKNGVVIPNPVASLTSSVRREKKRYTIAAIGRWSRIKNFQSFVRLHEELLGGRWPHRAIMVTSHRDDKFVIPETIERLDSMDQSHLKTLYRSIDLLVVPSLFETFCNVAAEAIIHGAAVLVSEHIGFAEVLRKAGLGRMVIPSFDDTAKVAEAIKRLKQAPLTAREQKRVASLLDPALVHDQILTVLEHVLAGRRVVKL